MYICEECGKHEGLKYPQHLHTTGDIRWTCCECLGHGYGTDGICIRFTEERERKNMKTGREWEKEYGVTMLDPDGFGERAKGMPRYSELMTEAQFQKGIVRCTCQWDDMALFQAKLEG